MMKLGG